MSVMWLPDPSPWKPPAYDEQVIMAIRAIERGVANAAQQQLFWRYMMFTTGASDEFADLSYRPNSERDTVFAEGKRFVGLMFRKLLRAEFTPKPKTPEAPKAIQRRMRERRTQKVAA